MPNTIIKKIIAREVLDSRGNPTIEVDVFTSSGFGREMVPSGSSTGIHEAKELRDGGKRYCGKGVLKAVHNVNKIIAPKLLGRDSRDQIEIDKCMISLDGTNDKSFLGSNALLGVSLAVARSSAVAQNLHMHDWLRVLSKNKKCVLPTPFMNLINGGKHAVDGIDFQEFMLVPQGKTFAESLRMVTETYHLLRNIIQKKYGKEAVNVGDEGGFTPHCHSDTGTVCERVQEPLELLSRAIEQAGYEEKIAFAIDAAASQLYSHKKRAYNIQGIWTSPEKLADVYEELVCKYPLISIEDPFAQDSWQDFAALTEKVSGKAQIVGDDLLCTDPERIAFGIKQNACSCALIKINQIGTLTEAIHAAQLAQSSGWNVMISHRSGETENHFIADFAVGLGNEQIKAGAPCRGERTAKYNQLLRIEQELGKKAVYCRARCWL